MEEKEIKVLHIDSERIWRGGQQQAVYLHEGLLKNNVDSNFICQPNSELYKYFRRNNVKCHAMAMRSEIDLLSALKISKYCTTNKINIITAHSAHSVSIGILTQLFNNSIKLVAIRRVDFSIRKNFISRFKYNSDLIDKHVCISEKIRNVLLSDRLPEQKLVVIKDGIDPKKFKVKRKRNLRSELGISSDAFVVGTVAAVVGHKDYPNLIGAAQIVCNENPNVVFVAVGDGELKNKMRELVTSSGLKNRFIFTGHRTDVADFYNMFDLFVLASKKEGLGTSVLDAMAMGLPVVATDAGGIPEMIQNENNGLLVEKQNSQKFAEAILRLTENEKLRTRLSKSAVETVKDFDVSTMINSYIELYHDLLEC